MYDSIKQKGKRKRLVEKLVSKGIKDKRVLDAILNITRHFFLDKDFKDYQYTINDLVEFHGFQIKVIMSGSNQAKVPRIRDFRTIALA